MAYFHCPTCGYEQRATDAKIGRTSTCPKCNAQGKVVRELAEAPLPIEGYPAQVASAVALRANEKRRQLVGVRQMAGATIFLFGCVIGVWSSRVLGGGHQFLPALALGLGQAMLAVVICRIGVKLWHSTEVA